MLDAKEIDLAIAELEYKESSYHNYQKLANLYTIRKEMQNKPSATSYEREYSGTAMPEKIPVRASADVYGDSDFLQAVSGKEQRAAWIIMDELMDTLKVVNQRVYDGVMRKIRAL